jgi:ZIP family zinc transporter
MMGFGASVVAGLATAVGALPILAIGKPSDRQQNIFLGFAAGVMLAASFFSLIIPGIEQGEALGASRAAAAGTIVAAVLLGGLTLSALSRFVPVDHIALLGRPGASLDAMKRIWLFVAAITLHNFPEGMAVGVSFGTGDVAAGTATAIGIGVQNMPEGLAVAAAVATLGYSRRTSFLVALASGLVEPLGGLFGVGLASLSASLLPWGLGFAAGAMIYVVASEIIPETHERMPGSLPAHGLMVGLVAMMFLDVTLG